MAEPAKKTAAKKAPAKKSVAKKSAPAKKAAAKKSPPAKKSAAKKAPAKRATTKKEKRVSVKKGDLVLVAVDPRQNNGDDEALAVVVRAWTPEMVNLRLLMDSEEVRWMTSVSVVSEKPEPVDNSDLDDTNQADLDEKATRKVNARVCWPL